MTICVILLSMGGPDRLENVRPFLFNLFNDPAIMRIPQPFRWIVAFLISGIRAKRAKGIYQRMGGHSPLLENTRKQAVALQAVLGTDYRCFVGMSYSHPFIYEAVHHAITLWPEQIVLLPLYPQYSTTTTFSALKEGRRALARAQFAGKVSIIDHFYDLPTYIDLLVERTKQAFSEAQEAGAPRVLFSAHGLPERIVKQGDPYPDQCARLVDLILQKMGKKIDSVLCFQSRLGPVRWIGPFTDEEIVKAAQDHRPIVIVPISFVCEHAETLVELHQEGRSLAFEKGCPFYRVVETAGDNQQFIQALAHVIRRC
ncbi:MAG: ferrochelatase [Proteobacteria bacterium]|jgi:ferrochelatase|nr:ferrochelatase [Alphaproteobacteria bacterium]NCC03627.1 ferrochelatase [Pseudomonadota bacterium]